MRGKSGVWGERGRWEGREGGVVGRREGVRVLFLVEGRRSAERVRARPGVQTCASKRTWVDRV